MGDSKMKQVPRPAPLADDDGWSSGPRERNAAGEWPVRIQYEGLLEMIEDDDGIVKIATKNAQAPLDGIDNRDAKLAAWEAYAEDLEGILQRTLDIYEYMLAEGKPLEKMHVRMAVIRQRLQASGLLEDPDLEAKYEGQLERAHDERAEREEDRDV